MLEVTAKGFGFVAPTGQSALAGGKDIFIARSDLGGAVHGDTVAVRLLGTGRGRQEGVVCRVLQRAWTQVCGIFSASPAGGFIVPDNERLSQSFVVGRTDALAKNADGLAVLAEILDYGSESRQAQAKIVQILGDPLDAAVQERMALFAAGLATAFPKAVLAEVAALPELSECEPGREDLRHLPHVTIDGGDARDFDDAICVARAAEGGFMLYVSIADVSHYVRPGSAVDREAYRRGTSVYLPGRVLPMLPERLSNDLCSLMPDVPRPAFTAILRFDAAGRRTGQRFTKSLIQSARRCTYAEIDRLLFQDGAPPAHVPAAILPMLELARSLARLLKAQRLTRGGLEFDAPEPEVELKGGRVVAIRRAARTGAHMLIEDCMLAANEAVAETLARARQPVLYRIHEAPDPEKLEIFADAARSLGLRLPSGAPDSGWVAQVLALSADLPQAYMISNLLLRSMLQARYSPENLGHFGLAADTYLHFTSPIRRYPDLIAHRVLQAWLQREQAAMAAADLAEAGLHLSRCERRAIELERDVLARMAVLCLHGREGESFGATISGLSSFGLYLDLEASGISGGVPMSLLPADYYLLDKRRHRLIGERHGRIFQLGDVVQARLESADITTRRLVFSLA